ncbi:hypothetical protein [Methylomonas fluvii]|uniref:Uncharacterized protein n=1 Tax=Methylomonas fluvii TaxID=1854564 RepID=A0ABR9DHD1_9GAMM|nr:hypothetical protein [Methylomonas fluvii]MBD9362480.1 hypothetical protein [Methylomonas fluvii]
MAEAGSDFLDGDAFLKDVFCDVANGLGYISLRFFYVLVLALAFPVLDMLAAWLYGGGLSQAGMLRVLRDVSIVAIALLCL